MKKRNKLIDILHWVWSVLKVLGIPFSVWLVVLLYRRIHQWTSIKISIGYFFVFCLVTFLIWYFISRSVKRRKERQSDWTGVGSIPKYGYEEKKTVIYEGVKWVLLLPKLGPLDSHPLLPSPSPLEIAEKLEVKGPFCPKCDTELEENKKLFRYNLTCIKCGFRMKKKIPVYKLREKTCRFYKPDIREHLRK